MLKSKIAMALAAAMVMAALYGCSSSSDSGLKSDASALQGTIDKVAMELGLPAGATEMAILDALEAADADQLVAIRTALGLGATATGSEIVAAINRLGGTPIVLETDEQKTTHAHHVEIVRAIRDLDAMDMPNATSTRPDVTAPVINGTSLKVSILSTIADAPFEISDMDAPEAEGWSGSMLTRESEAAVTEVTTTDKVFVYHNRMEPGDEEYADYYKADGSGPAAGPGAAAVMMVDAEGVLELATGDVSADSALFTGAIVPTAAFQTVPFVGVDDEDTDAKENEVAGGFHGVPGTYTCTEDPSCTVSTDKDGMVSMLGAGWTFTADEPAEDADPHMVLGVTPKADYVYFGYWLKVIDDDGDETIEVNHFAAGGGDAATITDVVGTASYSGKAGGKYAVKTLTRRGELATLHTGQFVADVNIDVSFGGGQVAPDNEDTATGNVTGFVDSASTVDRIGHWDGEDRKGLVLMKASLADLAGADGGDTTGGGAWSAMFYGPSTVTVDGDEEPQAPPHMSGTFDGHFSDGHVIGAYGATKDAAAE